MSTVRERPPRRAMMWVGRALAGLVAVILAGALLLDSSIGHRFVADRVAALRPTNGLRYSVGRINGSLFSQATLIDFRISDAKGLVLVAPRAELDWRPFAWLSNRLQIERLTVRQATLVRLPEIIRTGKPQPILPSFDIWIGMLRIDRLMVARGVTGTPRVGRIAARADIHAGRALIDLAASVAGSDRIRMLIDAAPDRDRFAVDVKANGAADGLLATMMRLKRSVALTIDGKGRWQSWRGTARGAVGDRQILDLALGNAAGRYTLSGAITAQSIVGAKQAALLSPSLLVNGAATLVDRQLAGTLSLRSSAVSAELGGGIDLAGGAYRDLRLLVRLLKPAALVNNMVGRGVELRTILDGAFATARFDYRLSADFASFGKEGFETVRAGGQGRLSKQPVLVPIKLSVARVTGVDAVAGSILRNLVVDGLLRVTSTLVSGADLKFRSDKLAGSLNVLLDLRTGRYDVALNGKLGRFLIPGLGIVDVVSRLQVVPDPNGRGARIIGTGSAQMVRLDNEFFRTLSGGLPRLTANLEQSTDGILHFNNVVLTAPDIRITGSGFHRRDNTFFFEGQGTQRVYGPFTLKLDGIIERPKLDIHFAHPNAAMGLTNVDLHLVPIAEGFGFTASGGSAIGHFDSGGRLVTPKGAEATIDIARFDAGDIHATGSLVTGKGGLDGSIRFTGSGVNGTLALAPVHGVQRIEAHLDARAARFGEIAIRRGHIDAVAIHDPDGASIEGSATASGLRRGALGIGQMTAKASLRGGTGTVEAAISGTRGRAFDIRAKADVTPDTYRISAEGTVDRRPIKLLTPAVVTHSGDRWMLAQTALSFAGGNADVAGEFTAQSAAVRAKLAKIPLTILDIAYPGLGLSGTASGKLDYAQGQGRAPTGRIDMTVRGLSRSGLVLSSQPIDVGLAGVLNTDTAALRAVMESGGKTIGRAQARLSPLGAGSLTARLANAQLFAQLRYNGPADTLWRLTGLELFDLSGPVAIGADLGGKVNDPRIKGVLRADGARIESTVTGTVLTNIKAAGAFDGSRLVIDNFAADAGKGGRVTGGGSFDFAAVNGFGIDLKLQADNAVMINRDDIGATVTGPLTIRSDGSGGVIGGDIRLVKSRYRLGQAVAASAVPKLNIREINLPGGGEEDIVPEKPWQLKIKAHADDSLAVTGLGLTSNWSANLSIQGTPENPQINGRADILRGVYEFSGREFTIERGVIRFEGEVPANPAIDISANADATGLSAVIRVTGQAIKPEISFTSTPALPQDELLSRLLFGTSITKLSAPEALQLAAAVASLQGGGNGLNPINALRRVAGLDRLRILPADTQVGRTTSVAAGKYITRRLYAEIITDGQGYSATQVEFQVTRWLSILSTISTLGRQSANIRVSKDY